MSDKPSHLQIRRHWYMNPVTRVVDGKKGRGTYNRNSFKQQDWRDYLEDDEEDNNEQE